MKKRLWLATGLSLSLILFFSCSNTQNSVLTTQENTLRSAVQEKNGNTTWSNELEPQLLNKKANSNILVSDKNSITPQFLASVKGLQPPVYPQIKNFASLDCSSMNTVLINLIQEFADALCQGTEELDSYFQSDYFFNYVFFKNDLEQLIGDVNFTKYLICQGFESTELTQVPIRFYNQKEFVDLSLYLSYHGGYKITQIEIISWGNINGETDNTISKNSEQR